MSRRHLPSFAALRAFDAVAETLSFTRAVERLGVTQAAVSRQIRSLESELGVSLVERRATHNELTAAGVTLHEALRAGLDRIAEAVRAVSNRAGKTSLTVSVAPFLSAVWLTPRIMRFVQAHPEIALRLHHSYTPPDYRHEQIDLGINWGDGSWPGVVAEKVFDGSLTPVCSPGFLRAISALQRPEDLLNLRLFYEFRLEDWEAWFAAAAVAANPGVHVDATRIDDSSALRRVALDGHGVALFFSTLVAEDLERGTLVQPFPLAVDTGHHYFLSRPAEREPGAASKAFRRWLRAQIEEDAVTGATSASGSAARAHSPVPRK